MRYLVHHLLADSAARTPDAPCILDGDHVTTFAALDDEVGRLAGGLVRLGVGFGDRVAVHLGKTREEAASMLAASRADAVFVNINTQLRGPQVRHILSDSGAVVLITHRGRLRGLTEALAGLPSLKALIIVGGDRGVPKDAVPEGLPWVPWDEAVAGDPPPPTHRRRVETDPAGIIYTSGSSGAPKGVVVSHRNVVCGAGSVSSYVRNTPDDVILSVLPFSFDYGMNQLMCALRVGCALALCRYLGPGDILEAAKRHRATGLAGIPPIWSALLQLDWDADAFAHLRYITNSGGAFPVEHVRAYRERLPHTQVFLMYGLTEAFRSTYLDPAQVDVRPDSMGKAIPDAEIVLVDDDDQLCGPGEIGQLVHRGPLVALGYWNDPVRTAERFRPDPLAPKGLQVEQKVVYSGDYVRMDAEGYLYFVGRRDMMIKTSGFRVSPDEVEAFFYDSGLVRDAVALGLPDPDLGQRIRLIAAPAAGQTVTAEQLIAAVQRQMPSYMVPKEVELRDSLPRNANGKLDRARLAREARGEDA